MTNDCLLITVCILLLFHLDAGVAHGAAKAEQQHIFMTVQINFLGRVWSCFLHQAYLVGTYFSSSYQALQNSPGPLYNLRAARKEVCCQPGAELPGDICPISAGHLMEMKIGGCRSVLRRCALVKMLLLVSDSLAGVLLQVGVKLWFVVMLWKEKVKVTKIVFNQSAGQGQLWVRWPFCSDHYPA